jgi:hypothetical protein
MRNAVIIEAQGMPTFATEEDARDWMYGEVDDPFVDNDRFYYEGDTEGTAEYERQIEDGCCGFFDRKISIAGRLAWIGCNYGH